MPRIARIVAPELPHHVTQRGNNRQLIFHGKEDSMVYLEWFREYAGKHGLAVLGYCLMHNHVHFIVIPRRAESMAEVFKLLNTRYSHYVNRKMENCGHLWQGRFYSCIVDGPHLLSTLKYVECNPVRAGMALFPWEWELSSALEHIGKKSAYFEGVNFQEYVGMTQEEWKLFIATPEAIDSAYEIRRNTHSGLPLVNDACLEKLKITLGLSLTNQKS